MSMQLDVAMPTLNSESVIVDCLEHLRDAVTVSRFEPGVLRVSDGGSKDDTIEDIERWCDLNEWEVSVQKTYKELPKAREELIGRVRSDWFLFLDDDVRLDEGYLIDLGEWIDSDGVGAVHGRKANGYDGDATAWKKMRTRRGATHATLMRTDAVKHATIPDDLTVLEDEYLRQVVEERGYNWVFDHRAIIRHECQNRHPKSLNEGYLAGKYDLMPGHYFALNVPYAVVDGRSPWPDLKRASGWAMGRVNR